MGCQAADLREALRRLFRKLGFMERDEARCCSMSLSRCQVLVEIGRRGGVSLVDLSVCLGLDKSTVSRLVDGLVEDGFAERRESSLDRRYLAVALTEEGQTRFVDIEARMDAFVGKAWERVPEERRGIVLESLRILEEAFLCCENCCDEGEEKD
ncbi:MAG: MarR family winged helix-turn-helix transcriptional regulator [Synergistales bacterium]|jgi:DNA-binding MarR family transcriptional regulator